MDEIQKVLKELAAKATELSKSISAAKYIRDNLGFYIIELPKLDRLRVALKTLEGELHSLHG